MKSQTKQHEWMNDPLVKDIDRRKLEFLEVMFTQVQGKSQKELMALMVPLMKRIKEENLSLSSSEMNAAVAAIKKHSTAEELKKIDEILAKNLKATTGN